MNSIRFDSFGFDSISCGPMYLFTVNKARFAHRMRGNLGFFFNVLQINVKMSPEEATLVRLKPCLVGAAANSKVILYLVRLISPTPSALQ